MLVVIYIGNYYLYEKIISLLDETDKLIYLGDACDRGPDGIHIMQSLLHNNKVIYLLGNHERMFLNAICNLNSMEESEYNSLYLYFSNGGHNTYYKYLELEPEQQERLKIGLHSLPLYAEYINKNDKHIILSHSGFDIDSLYDIVKGRKKQDFFKYYSTIKVYSIDEDNFIWNREHLNIEHWSNNSKYTNTYMVHGHTPTITLYTLNSKFEKLKEPKIVKYCDYHKIDIDLGTYNTNMTVLLDLDTFEPIYIK